MRFQDWERETIDKETIEYLPIPNHLEFENDELVIEGYPNLKELIAFSCSLKKITVNAPKLEILNLSDNQLTELDVNRISLLEELTINNNKELTEINGFEKLTNLEKITCFECKLKNFDCSNKDKLTDVFAANQFVDEFKPQFQGCNILVNLDVAENNILNLDCSNLPKLKDVSIKETFGNISLISSFFFTYVNKKWAENSYKNKEKILTLAKEFTTYLRENITNDKSFKKKLSNWIVFFKDLLKKVNKEDNFLKEEFKILIEVNSSIDANFEGCTNLENLNFSKSNINSLNVNECSSLKGVIGGWLDKENDLDKNGKLQYITNSKGEQKVKTKLVKPIRDLVKEPWYNSEFWTDRTRFPKLEIFHIDDEKATELEDLEYGERIYSYQQEKAKENIQSGKHLYYGTTHLDLSHHKYIGAMNLNGDGYPDTITSINLGDNYLTSLKVSNFPNLERLIISHNTKLTKETIIIENCPKLSMDGIFPTYHYKSDDESRGIPEDGKEYDEERDNPLKQKAREEKREKETKEKLNQQVRKLLAKNEEEITLPELLNIFKGKPIQGVFWLLEEDIKDRFFNLFKRKLEVYVLELINKTKMGEINTNQLAEEIYPLRPFFEYLSNDTKDQLRNLLETVVKKEEFASPDINFPRFVFSNLVFFFIGLIIINLNLLSRIIYLIRKKKIKSKIKQ